MASGSAHPSDEELLERLRNPDTASNAFNQLVRQYQEQLYRVIRRLVLVDEVAQDLLQEAFVKAWRNIDRFRSDAKLSTWLYRIATNEALSYLRKQKRTKFLQLEDAESFLSQKLDQAMPTDGDAIEQKLQQAILRLPERQRLVFQLRYYDEMPYEEMGELLGLTAGALKASYHHAVKKIEAFVSMH